MTHWDERYDTEEYVYGVEPNAFLRSYVEKFPLHGRILVIAEGEGRNAVWLAEQGGEVEAWDLSRVGLAKAKALATSKNVSLQTRCVDLGTVEWPEHTYDAVVCIFGHFPESVRTRVLAGVDRTLKPGGHFFDRSVS